MRPLDVKALTLTTAILWGGGVLAAGLAAWISAGDGVTWYAKDFLAAVASIYPGYHGRPELGDTLVGAAWAVVDGGVGGALFALLYNRFVGRRDAKPAS